MVARITISTVLIEDHALLDVGKVTPQIVAKGGAYPAPVVEMIVRWVNEWCDQYRISPRVVMAQILHETGWFRFGGDVKWWQFNFAGLGATGGVLGHNFTLWKDDWVPVWWGNITHNTLSRNANYTADLSWIEVEQSVRQGTLAVVQHHAVYIYGIKKNWPTTGDPARDHPIVDPRYYPVLATGRAGKIRMLGDYRGNWAVPGTTYPEMIVAIANTLAVKEEGGNVPTPRPFVLPFPLRVSHIPWGNPNRPGVKSLPSGRGWITVHETGNTRVGANAGMHRVFTHNGGGAGNVSFTYVVDDHEAIELLPRGEKSWQASDGSDGPGNSSVSIETCVNSDGNWNKTFDNLVNLIVWLIVNDPNLSVDRIAQHNKWARDGKNCPTIMRSYGGEEWGHLLSKVRVRYEALLKPEPAPTPVDDPNSMEVNGFFVINKILHKWKSIEDNLPIFGYPISGQTGMMVDGVWREGQFFERGVLCIYAPGTPDGVPEDHPFHVRMLTLQEQDEAVAWAIEEGILEPFE